MTNHLTRATFALLLFVSAIKTNAQVSGTVFKDFNFNGTQQTSGFPIEPGAYGVQVKAFNAAGTQLGATKTTTVAGTYNFTAGEIPSGTAVRIEFTALNGTSSSKSGAGNGSNIQFVSAPSASVHYAIASEDWYSSTANPYIATTAATNGNAVSGGTAGTNSNLYVFPWDMGNGTPNDGGATRRLANSQTGTTFGLAFQHSSRTLLMAAYLKRHSSFGPNGIGAIYKSQISVTGVPAAATLLVDVSAIGINVGTTPRTVTLPAASSGRNSDVGVFSEIGKRGIGGIDLSENGSDLYIVNMFEKKLHRINIGNPLKASFSAADVTGSWVITDPGIAGTVWHPMACKVANGKVYVGGVTVKEQNTAFNLTTDTVGLRGIVYEFNPSSGTFTEVLRFPLSRRRGFSNSDYRYPTKNNWWCSWQNNGNGTASDPIRVDYNTGAGAFSGGIYYPQPMLSDIEFDVDGSMILGIRDRFGDQTGYQNLMDDGEPTTAFATNNYFRGLTSGELLRAGKNIGANTFAIENLGGVITNGVATSSAGLAVTAPAIGGSWTGATGNAWGGQFGSGWGGTSGTVPAGGPNPGTQGGYFYFNHNFETNNTPATLNYSASAGINSHYVKSNGGIALLAGSNEVAHTLMDPIITSYAQGINKCFNSGANAGNMSQRLELLLTTTGTPGDPANNGKSNGVGDLELLTDAQPIEIGNRIWLDANDNGYQDAGETTAGVPTGTTVSLYTSTNVLVATTTTDANGNYYFSTLNVANDPRKPASWIGFANNAILPGFDYQIRLGIPGGYHLATTDAGGATSDNIDNDAIKSGGYAHVNFNTSSTNHNFDIGIVTGAILPVSISFNAVKQNTASSLTWTVGGIDEVKDFVVERSTDDRNFIALSTIIPQANSTTYSKIDAFPYNGINYYRIKVTELNGRVKYSEVRLVNFNSKSGVSIFPNPANDKINIQLPDSWQNKQITIDVINQLGQAVLSKQQDQASQVESIDVSKLPAGIYNVRLSNSQGQTEVRKIQVH